MAVFDAPLWNPAPPPEPAVAEVPAQRARRVNPPAFQLVAISLAGNAYSAELYTPEDHRYTTAMPGDDVAGYRIASVDANAVHVEKEGRTFTLRLREPDRASESIARQLLLEAAR